MRAIGDLLDRAAAAGRTVDLWWRDDDAVAATPALDRLLALAERHAAPPALAAIPAEAGPDLAARLAAAPGARVLVHGWRHRNGEAAGAKSSEFGGARPLASREGDAASGLAAIRARFGTRALPVFVPPWNRIGPDLAARLPALGYEGLSCFAETRLHATGLRVVNTHLDPVDWRGGRGPVGEARLAEALRAALATDGPVGLLTHHLAFDAPLWRATETLVATLSGHPATRWIAPSTIWASTPS